ncbi:MAG: hypothetical protein ACTHJM_02775 [Marmoricola sp.]
MILAWHDGAPHDLTPTEWAEICAGFLGSGFRVDLPSGSQRREAAAYELDRVRRVAELLGAGLVAAEWEQAATSHPDAEVEITGGWPRSYADESRMWVTAIPLGDEPTITTIAVLPEPAHQRPTSGLPMFSRLADEVALAHVDVDCAIWADSAGRVVTSTAGPILAQRVDGRWAMGSESGSWLYSRLAADRGATGDLMVDDLATARFIGVVRRAREVQQVAYLT